MTLKLLLIEFTVSLKLIDNFFTDSLSRKNRIGLKYFLWLFQQNFLHHEFRLIFPFFVWFLLLPEVFVALFSVKTSSEMLWCSFSIVFHDFHLIRLNESVGKEKFFLLFQ